MTCTLTHSDLAHFTGSEHMHFNPLFGRQFNYTDGVQFLGANGCGWLVDKILSILKFNNKVKAEDFVCITLHVNDKKAKLYFTDGNMSVEAQTLRNTFHGVDEGDGFLHFENIDYTDCTVPEIKFFFTDNVLMLSSEY